MQSPPLRLLTASLYAVLYRLLNVSIFVCVCVCTICSQRPRLHRRLHVGVHVALINAAHLRRKMLKGRDSMHVIVVPTEPDRWGYNLLAVYCVKWQTSCTSV